MSLAFSGYSVTATLTAADSKVTSTGHASEKTVRDACAQALSNLVLPECRDWQTSFTVSFTVSVDTKMNS